MVEKLKFPRAENIYAHGEAAQAKYEKEAEEKLQEAITRRDQAIKDEREAAAALIDYDSFLTHADTRINSVRAVDAEKKRGNTVTPEMTAARDTLATQKNFARGELDKSAAAVADADEEPQVMYRLHENAEAEDKSYVSALLARMESLYSTREGDKYDERVKKQIDLLRSQLRLLKGEQKKEAERRLKQLPERAAEWIRGY